MIAETININCTQEKESDLMIQLDRTPYYDFFFVYVNGHYISPKRALSCNYLNTFFFSFYLLFYNLKDLLFYNIWKHFIKEETT